MLISFFLSLLLAFSLQVKKVKLELQVEPKLGLEYNKKVSTVSTPSILHGEQPGAGSFWPVQRRFCCFRAWELWR